MNIKKANPAVEYVQESILELRKVTWPTKQQAFKLTLIVLGFCVVAAVLIGAIDFALKLGYGELLNLSR